MMIRTNREKNLIRKKPWGDKDGDLIPNWVDCKPYNKMKQGFEHRYSFSSYDYDVTTREIPPRKLLETTYKEIQSRKKKGISFTAREREFMKSNKNTQQGYEKIILSRKNIKHLKKFIPHKKKNVPIPFLQFDIYGNPVAHQGRHTSKAAEELGYKTIPITVEKIKGTRTPLDIYPLYKQQYQGVKIRKPLKSFHYSHKKGDYIIR
jgi:hypothetical protein